MLTPDDTLCTYCGMTCAQREYHTYGVCLMLKACRNYETVLANLAAMREHFQAEVRKDDEARIAEHEQALAFLAGLYCGDLTISEPPMTVAERIFDSVMAERAGLKAEIQQKEEALEFLRSAWSRARLEKAP